MLSCFSIICFIVLYTSSHFSRFRHSVRVLFGGRRWWYQPQAVVPERGGLIESPAVWFVSRILRTHGFDHTTLESYVGNVVTSESWQFGDIVVPRKLSLEADISSADSVCGRIVPSESIYCKRPSPFATPELVGRKSKTVLVEYVNKKFSELVGLAPDLYSDESSVQLQTCRVRVSELVYSTVFHGSFVFEKTSSGLGRPKRLDWCHPASLHGIDSTSFCLSPQDVVGSNTKKDVAGIAELDVRAIESVTKECRNHPGSLASLFAVGLPGAIITAIEKTKEKAEKEEPKEQQSQVVEALGALLFCVSTTLFSSLDASSDSDKKKADIVGGSTNPTSGDADDSMEEASSIDLSGNQSNIAEEVGAANSRVLGDPSRSARLSSLQERRNVLLALMSRARRGNARGAGSLNELAERDADDMGSLRQMMPGIPLGPGAAAGPFFSGAEADIFHDRSFDEFFAMSSAENPRDERAFGGASEGDPGPPSTGSVSRIDKTNPFLWSIIRGSSAGPAKRLPARDSSGISVPAVLRSLGLNAFLTNSYEWAEALIEMQSNEKPISTQSSSLRRAYDEDETPILQVAISLGCSLPILKLLLQCGAPVGETDVQKAAYTNQPSVLALLLHHATHSHDSIDLDRCSPTVADVVKRAGIFQEELKQKMTDQSGDFVAASLCLLVQFGLLCRSNRHKSTHWTACSDTVTGTLSGHSMLRALQTQQTASGTRAHELTDTDEDHNHDADEANSTTNLCEEGLLSITPADVLAKAFLADSTCALTNLLLLIEDSLYSKAVSDGAVGLTMLMVLLQKFPFLRSSAEMQRYGFGELVAFHSTLASRRLADAVGKKGGKRPNAVEDSTLDCSKQYDGSIRCPAKHVAVLHITRHSSFRCDLCGKGVDRGRPMHGCRECDWDACFECTDSTTAHAKNAHVKFLAEKCHESLASNCSGESITGICKASVEKSLEMLSTLDNSKGLHNLSICIKQRDCAAMRELARMLEEPGQITNYQFAFSILPSLHVSLLGKGSELERSSCLGRKSVHRNKKARVVGDCGKGASDIAKYLLYRESHGKDVVMEEEPNEDENKPSDSAKESIKTGENNKSRPEIFRRLHKVLSFNETLSSGPISPKGAELGSGKGTLKSLTQPIEVQLWPSNESQTSLLSPASTPMTLKIEPLVCLEDVELHVLRTCKVAHPTYLCFCQQLAREGAIIVEQARIGRGKKWRLGKINSYDEELGCHTLNYAVAWKDSDTPLELNNTENFRNVEFTKVKTRLVLAAREYYVLGSDRATNDSSSANADIEEAESMEDVNLPSDLPFVGARVELRNVADEDERKGSQTVLAVIPQTKQCVLVSDTGIVSTCSSSQIFAESFARTRSAAERRRRERRQDRDPFSRGLPFFRTHLSELARQDGEPEQDIANQVGVMKRTWSALSLLEKRQPVEVTSRSNESTESEQYAPGRGLVLRCEQGELLIDQASIEVPPLLNVSFGAGPLSTVDISSSRSLPLVGALKQLKRLTERQCDQGNPGRGVEKLYFAINTDRVHAVLDKSICRPFTAAVPVSSKSSLFWPTSRQGSRARKARANSISEEEEPSGGLCDGLGETCVQSMEVLGLLADFSDEPLSAENKGLSQQLAESLDDPLTVVGGALPEWTTAAPMFAPKLFSYDARRLLLERSAFGVSRSALRQQEAKVNVDRLRERMASLRARAVELVGEAFSGGAEGKGLFVDKFVEILRRMKNKLTFYLVLELKDPTALQLQADELYGMEESLSNRIKAAFRAEQWQEYALEVAKAAVERDCLLSDAEKIFERIAKADHICGRRIEVRFSKESGFDASTGSEAGVTRGFYADVAEALLSCENVSGVNCVQFCASFSKDKLQQDDFPKIPAIQCDPCKLPTFIPDTDASSQVIIPTPRSDSRSTLGVFPRPLLPQHPQFGEVLARYKFIGRLFAAAMRDSFMFPLPLSASFLKLVQRCDDSVSSLDDTVLDAKLDAKKGRRSIILTASDLPRPGFLGGEIYAVDTYICQALDRIDVEASDTPLSPQHVKRRYSEIASDKNFARVALGKHYELSFEEYFQDRTFVDPLDPTQGPEATPLCPNGYEKQVTIYNVRDYVALAKQFMLHDGVIGQAQAFRSGVDDFFPSEYLRLFTPEELQKDVCGTGDNVDTWTESDIRALLKLDGGKGVAEALVAVAAIGGEGGASLSRRFGASSPTIGHLVKALLEANPKRRRQFLSFVTSVPIVTPGKIEVVPVMSPSGEFQSMSDPSCLPRANTCARRLYLPKFENYKSFSEVLWAVVESHSKFKGFYEWRGS